MDRWGSSPPAFHPCASSTTAVTLDLPAATTPVPAPLSAPRWCFSTTTRSRQWTGWRACTPRHLAAPDRDLVTSRIVFLDRPDIVDSAGDGYLRAGGAFKHGHGAYIAGFTSSREVFGACGAAFLIRRDVFERLHGFDEDFFMVYEDVDLSYRARLAGYRCWYAADAVVRHAGSGTLGVMSSTAVFHGQRNLEWVWLKNTPRGLLLRTIPSHLAYIARRGSALCDEGARRTRSQGKDLRSPGTSRAHGEAPTSAARAPRCIQHPRASPRTRLDCPQTHREGTLAAVTYFGSTFPIMRTLSSRGELFELDDVARPLVTRRSRRRKRGPLLSRGNASRR